MSISRIIAAGFAGALALGAPALVTGAAAQEPRAVAPPMTFHVVDNFLKLPENITMAEVVGVTLDSKGHIYVLHRGQHPILEFNPDGSFVRTIGEGLPTEGPHNLRIDPQDNLSGIPRTPENPKISLAKRRDPDSTERMIRAGFLDRESRRDLIELARNGSVAHRLARRANALVLLDDGMSLRCDCEGAAAGRRHHPHLVSPV